MVVGLNFGRGMVRQIARGEGSPWFRLAGVCDLDAARAREVAAEYGVRAYASLDEVLSDPQVACVGLYSGPNGRAALLDRIIGAGKDVMTTKPLETDAVAALNVLRRARELGRHIHLNSPAPVPPADIRQILAWQEEFGLGQPVGVRADVWVSYREQPDGSWLDDPERCPVAPLFRLGIYLVNDLLRIFGPAARVQVLSSRLFTGRPTPDNAQMGILFHNGGLANIYASFAVDDGDYYRNSLTLNFQNGTVYRNAGPTRQSDGHGQCELSCIQSVDGQRKLVGQTVLGSTSGAYDWENFQRAVRGEELAGAATPEQIVSGLRLIEAMTLADQTGHTIAVKGVEA